MAKINIDFNDKNYSIDEASLSASANTLKSHLSTVMNGTGATINLGGTSYGVDATKLATTANAFVSHLGTVAGNGYKVTIGTATEVGSNTLVWDGNTEGLVSFVDEYEGDTFYKLSDSLPTAEHLHISVTKYYFRGTAYDAYGEDSMVRPEEDPYLAIADHLGMDCVIVILEPGVRGATETGVYFRKDSADNYVESLTIPGYTGFKTFVTAPVEYFLDSTKLSGAVAELKAALGSLSNGGCDTLFWDGNTEGLVSFVDEYEGDTFYKLSDNLLTIENLYVSETKHRTEETIFTYGEEDVIDYEGEPCFAIADVDGSDCVLVILESGLRGAPETGIYFRKRSSDYVESLSIPGYTGFPHSENCGH